MRLLAIFLLSFPIQSLACKHYAPCIMIKDFRERLLKHSYKPKRKPVAKKVKRVVKKRKVIENDLIHYAKSFIGIPYRFGGEDEYGIDCSAFVRKVYQRMGIFLPRTSRQQYSDDRMYTVRMENLQEGDLLFFKKSPYARISHVAIYIGDQKIIHSSSSEGGVYISKIENDNIWGQQFYAAKRIRR